MLFKYVGLCTKNLEGLISPIFLSLEIMFFY